MRIIATAIAALAAAAAMLGPVPASGATDEGWTQVSSKAIGGISGIAAAPNGWVVVRDNKKAGQNRVAVLDDAGVLTELIWPGSQPVDLEAIAAVPGQAGVFAAVTSRGAGHIISITGGIVTVSGGFTVPRGKSNIEGFALAEVSGETVALWAVRGSSTTPASVYAATFSPDTASFGVPTKGTVKVPYPTVAARQVADLAVVGGRIIASSTSDPGNSGPFASALYDVGSLGVSAGRAALSLGSPQQLGTYDHKVEGIACAGTTGILASDDEKLGGWIRMESFCG